jgi:hypothetical protein
MVHGLVGEKFLLNFENDQVQSLVSAMLICHLKGAAKFSSTKEAHYVAIILQETDS